MEKLAPSEEIRFFLGGKEVIFGTLLKRGVVCEKDPDKLDEFWVNTMDTNV
jgi:hypothetical protein